MINPNIHLQQFKFRTNTDSIDKREEHKEKECAVKKKKWNKNWNEIEKSQTENMSRACMYDTYHISNGGAL